MKLRLETEGIWTKLYDGDCLVAVSADRGTLSVYEGKEIVGTNTRYLHQSCDGGPVAGETGLVSRSGDGWREHYVIQ